MPVSPTRALGFPGWLVANCVVVTSMVFAVVFCLTVDSWWWMPEPSEFISKVLLWTILIGGPMALVLCCVWLHKIDKSIQHPFLRAVFCVMNFVGIGIGLVALLLTVLFVFRR